MPTKPFRLLAVDPGSTLSGYVILDEWATIIDFKTIRIKTNKPELRYAQDRLGPMFLELDAVMKMHDITHVAYEGAAKGGNVNSIIALSQVMALMELLAFQNSTRAIEVAPTQGKKALFGKGNATPEQMIATMRALLGDPALSPFVDEHNAHALGVGRFALSAIMDNNWQIPPRAAQGKKKKSPTAEKKPRKAQKETTMREAIEGLGERISEDSASWTTNLTTQPLEDIKSVVRSLEEEEEWQHTLRLLAIMNRPDEEGV